MHRRPTQGKTLVTNQYAELRVAYWFVANGISITPTIIKLLDKYFFPVLSLSLRVNYWIYLTLFLGGGANLPALLQNLSPLILKQNTSNFCDFEPFEPVESPEEKLCEKTDF